MKYEVRLQVIPDDLNVEVVPAFYLLDAEHFDKIAKSCQAHALPPEGVVDETNITATPAPVFEPPTEMPAEATETAPEATNEG